MLKYCFTNRHYLRAGHKNHTAAPWGVRRGARQRVMSSPTWCCTGARGGKSGGTGGCQGPHKQGTAVLRGHNRSWPRPWPLRTVGRAQVMLSIVLAGPKPWRAEPSRADAPSSQGGFALQSSPRHRPALLTRTTQRSLHTKIKSPAEGGPVFTPLLMQSLGLTKLLPVTLKKC